MKLEDKKHLEYVIEIGSKGQCYQNAIRCEECLIKKPCFSQSLERKKERVALAKLLLSKISIEAEEGSY